MPKDIFKVSVSIALLISLFSIKIHAQNWKIEEIGNLPFKTSNNAVALGYHNRDPVIFSFGGIDSTLAYNGIHLKCGSVNLNTKEFALLANLPDTLGKIAASASTVKNKIYVIDGYHV
ncbi:hypothetical protein N8368_01690 [Bacteroidia bacterium]|nr:hypothetical protein [Bacteroidia bacterium]MDC1395201.1 hypothetical protein [Bacteroidia bacterium]